MSNRTSFIQCRKNMSSEVRGTGNDLEKKIGEFMSEELERDVDVSAAVDTAEQTRTAQSAESTDKTDPIDSSADSTEIAEQTTKQSHAPRWVQSVRAKYHAYQETRFYAVWSKRPKFSYGAYVVVAMILTQIINMMLLWSVNSNYTYQSADEYGPILKQIVAHTFRSISSTAGWMNTFALIIIYLICVTLVNRFWIGTAIFGTIGTVFAFAGKVKVLMRQEPIIPSDLSFLTGGGGGENVASFVTDDLMPTIKAGIALAIWFVVICIVLQFVDRRRAFIYCSWKHPIAKPKNIFGTICRILAPILSIWLMVAYTGTLSNPNSRGYRFFHDIVGYTPTLWNVMDDAKSSGAATTFLSLTNVKAMDEPAEYSKSTMESLAAKYEKEAESINETRAANLTDNTVIMILSETFSDPNRVPDVQFATDPLPNIRSIMQDTTSGIMLSPGYGGGTANIEFQQMTGLSMALFNPTLLSPYQQLVANRQSMFSFNQMWNEACGSDECSVGFHPFLQRFYLRSVNYKKFGFSHLYTLDSDPAITHQGKYEGQLRTADNVSDEQAYLNVLDEVRENTQQNKPAQFIELITMQNHAPYPDLYGDSNEFHAANETVNTPGNEMGVIAEYAKGISLTDEATADFLNELDEIDAPITVVFYGDHLPGIYNTASAKEENSLVLHETDYFIWSNAASKSHDTKLSQSESAYTSSNYFMAQAADHMNAQVSPYLALLTKLHEAIPAISRSVTNGGEWDTNGAITFLDSEGKPIDEKSLSKEAQDLLDDYKLVQYDLAVGKNYLMDLGFTDLPK